MPLIGRLAAPRSVAVMPEVIDRDVGRAPFGVSPFEASTVLADVYWLRTGVVAVAVSCMRHRMVMSNRLITIGSTNLSLQDLSVVGVLVRYKLARKNGGAPIRSHPTTLETF